MAPVGLKFRIFSVVYTGFRRVRHRLHEEERRVLGKVLQHAVGGLIGIDSEARAEHGVGEMRHLPRETKPGREPQALRRQQAVIPADAACGNHRDRAQRRQRRGRRRQTCGISGHHKCGPSRRREIDVGSLICPRVKVLIELVTKARVQFQAPRHFPAIFHVQMRPAGVRVLGPFSDSHLRLRRIAQQEVGQRVSAVCAAVGVNAPRVIRVGRVEVQMKEVSAELDGMRAALDRDVVVDLEIPVGAVC